MERDEFAALICRVSSREQEDGYSLEAQERLLRESCDRLSLRVQVIHSFTETASKHNQRVKFKAFMAEVVRRKINHIVVEKVDRISRGGLREAVMMDDWLEADSRRHIHFVKDNIDLHKLSRSGDKLNWGMRVILAKNQTDNLREEIQKSTEVMLRKGIWPTGTPPGYLRDKRNEIAPIQPNPDTAPFIRLAFELYDSGEYSIKLVAERLNMLGLKSQRGHKLSVSQVHRILINKFYCGLMRYQGKLWPANHEPLVSQALFNRVSMRLHRAGLQGPIQYQRHLHVLGGLTVCGSCGKPLSWEIQKGRRYGYCRHQSFCQVKSKVKETDIMDAIKPKLAVLLIKDEELRHSIAAGLRLDGEERARVKQKLILQVEGELKHNAQRLSRLLELRIDGELSRTEYEEKKEAALLTEAQLKARLRELETREAASDLSPEDIFERGQSASKIFESQSPQDQRRLLREIFSQIVVTGTTFHIEYRHVYKLLARAAIASNRSKTPNFGEFQKRTFERS